MRASRRLGSVFCTMAGDPVSADAKERDLETGSSDPAVALSADGDWVAGVVGLRLGFEVAGLGSEASELGSAEPGDAEGKPSSIGTFTGFDSSRSSTGWGFENPREDWLPVPLFL